jgi:predicted sulfurtransferase
VATEGVNAQMTVPTNVLANFRAACESLPLFQGLYLNLDHQMSKVEFEQSKPFKNLHIRVREQIVADGFSEPLNWEKSGREVSH